MARKVWSFSGVRLRELREERDMSRERLAADLVKSYSVVRYYETGEVTPSTPVVCKMASLLKVHPGKLFVADGENAR